jgi:alpha-galactosidase/6-phospho-beta-glucosidase family protein
VEIQGKLDSEETIKIMEFYKNLGYNTVTSDYETLYLTKEDPEDLHAKEIKNWELKAFSKDEYISRLKIEIEDLKKKSNTDLREWQEYKNLKEHHEIISENLIKLSERHNEILLENRELEAAVKELESKIKRMKKVFFKKMSGENKE